MSIHVPPGGLPHLPVRLAGWNTLAGSNADTLRAENSVLSLDFLGGRGLVRDLATPANDANDDVNALATYASPSAKRIFNPLGVLESGTTLRCDHDPATKASSTDEVAIGWLTKTFTYGEAVTYTVGQWLRVSNTAAATTNYMIGRVTAASAGSVTIHVHEAVGAGSFSAWTLIEPLGLLVEEQRTNLCAYSTNIGGSGWTMVRSSPAIDSVLGLDGATYYDGFIPDATNNTHQPVYQVSSSITAGDKFTVSAVVKAGASSLFAILLSGGAFGTSQVKVAFDLAAVTATPNIGAPATSITNLGGGFYRVTVTATASDTAAYFNAYFRLRDSTFIGDNTNVDIHVGEVQVEIGASATSIIRTSSSQVTRAADDITVALADIPFSAASGSIVADIRDAAQDDNHRLWNLDQGTGDDRISAYMNTGGSGVFYVRTDDVQATLAQAFARPGKAAMAWSADDFSMSANGAAAANDNAGAVPTGLTTLRIGSYQGSGLEMNGHMRALVYWPRRISDAELQAEAA